MDNATPLKILVIEDNPGDFLLIRDYLEEQIESLDLAHTTRFSEARDLLNNKEHAFDVILLDLTLPDNFGEQLITDIMSMNNGVPVIVLTGFSDFDFGVKSLSLKASDYLVKDDISPVTLFKSIKYNIERKKTNLLLEESEKKYSNLFQLSPQPMWIFDTENFDFIQVNKAATDHYGYSEEEFLAMNLTDIVVFDREEENIIKKAKEISSNNNISKGRYTHRKKSGEEILVEIYGSKIQINDKYFESVIAIDVTEKVRTEHKITKAIIKTQEDERYEIGTELHDNVCQILASSQLSLDMLKDDLPPNAEQWFNKSKQFINLALEEIRNISHRLAPAFFDYTTIEDTFQELLNDINVNNKYAIELNIQESILDQKLPSELQLNLYRILQEQLRNITKYANATTIIVELSEHKDQLIFTIKDDGIGFHYDEVKKGIGLSNIKRRTELFLGNMEIESAPGMGCKMCITLPLQGNN
jgi:PAS domain S-box-containing protein